MDRLEGSRWSARRGPRIAARATLFLVSAALLVSPAAPAMEYSAQNLIAPYFAVEVGNPFGLTTLVALRNDGTEAADVLVTVRGGRPEEVITAFGYHLAPNQVRTFNLRDVVPASAAGADGMVTGWIVAQATHPALLSGDFFLVTPDQDFATGFELLDADAAYCRTWSTRFLNGGAFSGGTIYHVFAPVPRAPGLFTATVYAEDGTELGETSIGSGNRSFSIPASVLVPEGRAFGSLTLEFADGLDGIILAEHRASGRYAVGVTANCIDPGAMGSALEVTEVQPRVTTAGYRALIGAFEVEDDNPNGPTTLIAVRNEKTSPLNLNIFASGGGTVSLNRSYLLDPAEVKTLNLRDVLQGILDPDGFRRGALVAEDDDRFGAADTTPESFSGDFFNVDPGQDFATGGNLGGNRHSDLSYCHVITTRFLLGGVFTGGTIVSAYIGSGQGDGPDDPPTVVGTVYTEPGVEVGTFELKAQSGTHSVRFRAADVVPAGVAFGSIRLEFPGTNASVFTEHRAAGRFSVGVPGTCVPLP